MADFYGTEFIGGPDGTLQPAKKLDGRVVGAKKRRVRATKSAGQALAIADRMYIGKLPQGAAPRLFSVVGSASLGTSTLSIGTTAVPNKYVDAKTMTTADVPAAIGPKASALIADPVSADEDLWLTVGAAAIAGGTVMAVDWEYTIST